MIALVATALTAALMQPAAGATVTIEAREGAIVLPNRLSPGVTTFTYQNHGEQPHTARFLRLTGGHTYDDFTTWQKSGGAPPDWLEPAGGIAPIAPNASEQYTAALKAGSYVVLCTYPAENGQTHVEKGEVARLQVGGAAASARMPGDADVTVRLRDHGFQLSAPVPAGRPAWHLQNTGTEPHQAMLIRLPDGANEYTERAWLTGGGRGPRVGLPAGGVVELPAGGEAWFQVDLPPGRYLLLCSELEEEGRHFDLGMLYRFTIE